MLNGIDVSSNQPANICELVPYDFAIVKATGNPRGSKWDYRNPYMRQQVDSALEKTGCAGLYHFTYGRDAKEEADLFCDAVKDYVGRVVLAIDYEGDGALTMGREWLRTMIRRVKERTGVNPVVYASSSVIKSQDLVSLCNEDGCAIWSANYYAGYKAINGYSYGGLRLDIPESKLWQYTSTGYLEGYQKPLDLDLFYGDEDDWMALAGSANSGHLQTERKESELKRITNNGGDVYRLYDQNSGHHMYATKGEASVLIAAGWNDEGMEFKAPKGGTVAIYRMYDPNSGSHVFTPSYDEADSLEEAGWKYEGVPFFANDSGKAVHRLYNPNNGDHLLTVSDAERDSLVRDGWTDEGDTFRI